MTTSKYPLYDGELKSVKLSLADGGAGTFHLECLKKFESIADSRLRSLDVETLIRITDFGPTQVLFDMGILYFDEYGCVVMEAPPSPEMAAIVCAVGTGISVRAFEAAIERDG